MNEIRTLLKLTQQDMANLLGVSRSHYSMFESGKRSLPLQATQLIAKLASHLEQPNATSRNPETKTRVPERIIKCLEILVRDNEYQLLLIDKKLGQIAQKENLQIGSHNLLASLDEETKDKIDRVSKMRSSKTKSAKTNSDGGIEERIRLEIRKEVLEFERSVLTNRYENLAKGIKKAG